MSFAVEAFLSGCISKVINDVKDYSWAKIKSVINDRHDQNISTKICRVIERELNFVTNNTYKSSDVLYDAMEKIFIEFKIHGDTLESVKRGLNVLGTDVSDQRCENFLEKFYEGIRLDDDLYKEVMMDLEQKGIKISQEGFQKINEKLDNLTEIVESSNDNKIEIQKKEPVKSRTQEYADKWNENMFLNNFDKRDENAGVNVKLREVYLEEHLPNYIWKGNQKISTDLKDLLKEKIYPSNENQMLLIFGQPGIGKSTLITWITANYVDRVDDILVYKFASDLGDIDWHSAKLVNRILEELGLDYNDLNGKTIILDGLDEVSIDNRRKVLDELYDNLININNIKDFSLVITCRENYVQERDRIKGTYIILQPWDETQIRSFCDVFQKKMGDNISESTIENIIESRDILGIPLILYMTLALNISIEREGSIVDIYDKIFSLDGGIYDRCIDNRIFADKHRIGELKEQIHQVSRNIAIWMFENNPVGAYISKEEYQIICDNVMQKRDYRNEDIQDDFLIGNYFKLVKHCEGLETEELYFVHRSIYEYFVVETIYNSIESAMVKLTEESQEELAGKIANYLKQGLITNTIGEYLQYKFINLYNELSNEKKGCFYLWWETAVEKMVEHGMFYYCKNMYICENVIEKETQCFVNLLKILRLIFDTGKRKYILEDVEINQLEKYIRLRMMDCRIGLINGVETLNLSKTYLVDINLSGMDFGLINLQGANLSGANLTRADFRETNLREVFFNGANLEEAIFTERQVVSLERDYDLQGTRVEVKGMNKLLNYGEFRENSI